MVSSIGTVAGFFGCIAVGVISDRMRSRRLPILFLSTAGLILFSVMIFSPAGLNVLAYVGIWGGMCLCGSIWVLFFGMVGEVLPIGMAGVGLGLLNGLSLILSSLLAPVYGGLVDATGGYFVPSVICLGLSLFTVVMIATFTKETYGGRQVKSKTSTLSSETTT